MKEMVLVIGFCLLVLTLVPGYFPQNITNYGVEPCYAWGGHHRPNTGTETPPDTWHRDPPKAVSEPSTLALLGTGAASVGIYLFVRKRRKK